MLKLLGVRGLVHARLASQNAGQKARPLRYNDILKLVPNTKQVTLVTDGVAKPTLLDEIRLTKAQAFKILNMRPGQEDPQIVVSVVDKAEAAAAKAKPAAKQPKKPSQKDVQISWSISENDLLGQKRKAIESILSRGHFVAVKLQTKNRREPPPSANQLESRQQLVEKLQGIFENCTLVKKSGTLNTTMEFIYKP